MNGSNAQQQARTNQDTRGAKWDAAFTSQLTHDLADKVAAFAKRRARYVERKKGTRDGNLARELYQDALGDTWSGGVHWDPNNSSLELHLKRVITSRTSHELQRLERFPQVSVHAGSSEVERAISEVLEAERESGSGDLKSHVDDVVEALLLLAGGDDDVVQLLDAYGRGHVDRHSMLRATTLSSTAYHNARRRLLRLVEQLPQHVRDAAIEAMA